MFLIRYSLVFIVIALTNGCTSIAVNPVDSALDIKHICIKDCSERCYDGRMLNIIGDGFQRHGMTTETYSGDLPSGCEYNLTYYCERNWDVATYLHHAEIRIYQGKAQVGNVEYHLQGKGGFALNKWASTKSKIDPVIDKLLSNF